LLRGRAGRRSGGGRQLTAAGRVGAAGGTAIGTTRRTAIGVARRRTARGRTRLRAATRGRTARRAEGVVLVTPLVAAVEAEARGCMAGAKTEQADAQPGCKK
jgi:hypothetical protein